MSPLPQQRIQRFLDVLRDNGVRVAQQETNDAFSALTLLGDEAFADREVFRAALKTTLVKRPPQEPLFDHLFELCFGAGALGPSLPTLEDALKGRGADDVLAQALAKQVLSTLAAEGNGGIGQALMQGDDEAVAAAIREAMERAPMDGLTSPLQVGYYSQRLLQALDADAIEAELREAIDGADAEGIGGGMVEERMLALRRLARAATRREYDIRNATREADNRAASAAERPFRALTARDEEEMKVLIRRLAERLKARVKRRDRRARRGRLDTRATLRKSLATGGVPMRPQLVRRRRERPEIVVLCDISDSVQAASLFMLHFVYALRELFVGVKALVFVNRLGDASDLFASLPLEEAVERVQRGEVVSVFANSDYGAALRDFALDHLEGLTRRSTLIVLGDGRTNYCEPEAWVLEEARRRAKQVWWLSPEAQGTWGFGDSEMPAYVRACDRVFVTRTVADLAQVVDRLVV
jgi:uncharacterized protein with von Willebrand factor type A (vWA) domain